MKLPFAKALAIAKANGYTGDDKDPASVKSYLVANCQLMNSDGTKVPMADLEVVSEVKSLKVVTLDTDPPESPKAELPEDTDVKVAALVAKALKEAGVEGKGQRPNPQSVEVKSGEERWYEDQRKQKVAVFERYQDAKGMQHWLASVIAASCGNIDTAAYHKGRFAEVAGKAYQTSPNSAGGALIPEQYLPEIIRLVNEYSGPGSPRQAAKVVTMTSDRVIRPRRTGGLTMYYPQENAAATASTGTFDNVSLTARTGVVLTVASRQVLDDSLAGVSAMQEIMREIALAADKQESDNFWIGNGTSTYGLMTGYQNVISTTDSGGWNVNGGGTQQAHTLVHLQTVMARLPAYARRNARWFCSSFTLANVFDRLFAASGGVTWKELQDYGYVPTAFGRPIIVNESLPSTNDASGARLDLAFGDPSLACDFGDRQQIEIEPSPHLYFDKYAVAIRGVVRHDLNWHDVGTVSAAGPMVALSQT